QALDLLQAHLAAADHYAAPARQLQAGDVEGRLQHALRAAVVTDSPAQLAYALLAGVGLGGHAHRVVRGSARAPTRTDFARRLGAQAPRGPRSRRLPRQPASEHARADSSKRQR